MLSCAGYSSNSSDGGGPVYQTGGAPAGTPAAGPSSSGAYRVITGGAFAYPSRASIIGCSNAGKYLYIDSHYADSNFNLTVSTIIHEFQHLIHWGSKVMKTGCFSPNWYNEMLPMMSEDLFCSKLGLTDEDNPLSRLPLFNANWYAAGLEYRDGSGLQLLRMEVPQCRKQTLFQ